MSTNQFIWEGPLSIDSVALELKKLLFGPTIKHITNEALCAEVVRVAVWEQCVLNQPQTIADAVTSTRRVVHRARMLLDSCPLSPLPSATEDREDVEINRQRLDQLAEQGDLLSLSGGRWLPAPLRLVPISSDSSVPCLLVGGVPSSLLAHPVLQQLELHGDFRRLSQDVSCGSPYEHQQSHTQHWQFQSFEEWLGQSPESLEILVQEFKNRPLTPVINASTIEKIEVYNASIPQPQAFRWIPLGQASHTINGRYLIRSRGRWGETSYSIGMIERYKLIAQGQLPESFDIRRLCYALDALAETPTHVQWERSRGKLTLKSELPGYERKRLAVSGRLQRGDTYYPRIWHVDTRYEQEVLKLLSDLCIRIHQI